MKGTNFGRRDGATPTAKDAHVFATCFVEQLSNVREILDVAALIGSQGHGVGVFLNSTIDHGFGRLVVAEVNDFST